MSSVVNDDNIPNNVNLAGDRKLCRALDAWQPRFISWWKEMGPTGFQADSVFLRTATSVTQEGWAHFDYVKMPDYRWGIFLADAMKDRTIGFGDHLGKPVWKEVPGEHRNALRRLIVTQGDTEPASVEQQRMLGQSCPSVYDLRNLFQVNVEEGRHLWAMAYLLHAYFGRDGREEADELLNRRSGDPNKPRILGAFNEPCADWLSFFMFTFFTDRDGKFQLLALAESAFEPLSRTTRFMLTEEAHHMFVGETGVLRIVDRTAHLMRENRKDHPDDVRALGVIDLPTMQRYLNLWYSLSLDLFGGEISSNAAAFFAAGLKGRAKEEQYEDHTALSGTYAMDVVEHGHPTKRRGPASKRDERGAPRRLYRGLPARRRQVEPRDRLPRRRFQVHAAEPAVSPAHRALCRSIDRPGWGPRREGRVGAQPERVAPERRRQGVRREHHVPPDLGPQADGPLDQRSEARNQGAPRRFRVRAPRLIDDPFDPRPNA